MKLAIVSCMDTRLTELLPRALGLKNGDAKIIKVAGGTLLTPYDSVMRSLLVAIYELDCEEIMVNSPLRMWCVRHACEPLPATDARTWDK